MTKAERVAYLKPKTLIYRPPAKRLGKFWSEFIQAQTREERLNLVIEISEWESFPASSVEIRGKRHGFNSHKWASLNLNGVACSVCYRAADVRHHLIQLQNGGRNKAKNLIPLCNQCHGEVHYWLKGAA